MEEQRRTICSNGLWAGEGPAFEEVFQCWGQLLEEGEAGLVLIALGTSPVEPEEVDTILKALDSSNIEEELLRDLDDRAMRRGMLVGFLRMSGRLPLSLFGLLEGELEAFSHEDSDNIEDLKVVFKKLLALGISNNAIEAVVKAPVVASLALEELEPADIDVLLKPYVDKLIDTLYQSQPFTDDDGIMVTVLLASRLGSHLLTQAAESMNLSMAEAASALTSGCLQGLMNSVAEMEVHQIEAPLSSSLDSAMVRGALDQAQISYEDLSEDRWLATLRYKDEFGQKASVPMDIGLSARRLSLKVVVEGIYPPYAALEDLRDLLSRNHYSGLARYSLNVSGQLCVVVELSRESWSNKLFALAVDDLLNLVEVWPHTK